MQTENVSATDISIHALLAESDIGDDSVSLDVSISIHALLAESDSKKQQKIGSFVAELAILPLQYALSLDLSKYFRRYSSVFEKLFGAKVPEF